MDAHQADHIMAQQSLDITTILKRQLDCSLEMLAKAIELCPDNAWADDTGHTPVWEQVYHALFWFNAWLRDWSKPIEYPEFHIKEALDIKRRSGSLIDRRQMTGYLAKVRTDYEAFMAGLSDGYLNAILSATRGVRVHWIGYGER